MTKNILVFSFLSVVVLPAFVVDQAPAREELKLQLPKPMFIGTPTNIKSPNLEVITGKSRGPFLVPVGTAVLSLNRPVRASDTQPVIGELDHGDRRREGRRRRVLRRTRTRQAVGPD